MHTYANRLPGSNHPATRMAEVRCLLACGPQAVRGALVLLALTALSVVLLKLTSSRPLIPASRQWRQSPALVPRRYGDHTSRRLASTRTLTTHSSPSKLQVVRM